MKTNNLKDLVKLIPASEITDDKKIKSKIKPDIYNTSNVILDSNRFKTKDGFYETNKDADGYSYWNRTLVGEKNGATQIFPHINYDSVIIKEHLKEKAINNLLHLINKNIC
jgi:hypothetical protein